MLRCELRAAAFCERKSAFNLGLGLPAPAPASCARSGNSTAARLPHAFSGIPAPSSPATFALTLIPGPHIAMGRDGVHDHRALPHWNSRRYVLCFPGNLSPPSAKNPKGSASGRSGAPPVYRAGAGHAGQRSHRPACSRPVGLDPRPVCRIQRGPAARARRTGRRRPAIVVAGLHGVLGPGPPRRGPAVVRTVRGGRSRLGEG